jgi:hypothetical protein
MYISDAITDALTKEVSNHVEQGCRDASRTLGFCHMPHGYALMLNSDADHYYWLKHDGSEGEINWDRWAVYRSARRNTYTTIT